MSITLKRPMFRRGGSTNTGIMSGLVDRSEYSKGSRIDKEQLGIDTKAILDAMQEFSPVARTRLPIGEVGLALASGVPLVDALGMGYKKFVSKDDKRRALLAKRQGAAVSTALSQQFKKPEAIGTLKQGRNTSNQVLFGVKPGETGFFSPKQLLAAQGMIQPIDTRMAFTFDADTNTLSQRPVSEVDKIAENKRNAQEIVSAVNTVGALKDNMIERVKKAPTGAVGSVFGLLEGVSDQLSQVSESLGFNQNSLDFDVNTSEKLDKYLADKGVTRGATEFAKLKSSVINLAYNLAKIKEPGNPRLSEGDIIRQLDRIKFGSSRDVFIGALNQIYDDEVIGAKGQITGYGLDPDDFFKTKEDENGSKEKDVGTTFDPLNILKNK